MTSDIEKPIYGLCSTIPSNKKDDPRLRPNLGIRINAGPKISKFRSAFDPITESLGLLDFSLGFFASWMLGWSWASTIFLPCMSPTNKAAYMLNSLVSMKVLVNGNLSNPRARFKTELFGAREISLVCSTII